MYKNVDLLVRLEIFIGFWFFLFVFVFRMVVNYYLRFGRFFLFFGV